jgi:hypothetical protein
VCDDSRGISQTHFHTVAGKISLAFLLGVGHFRPENYLRKPESRLLIDGTGQNVSSSIQGSRYLEQMIRSEGMTVRVGYLTAKSITMPLAAWEEGELGLGNKQMKA